MYLAQGWETAQSEMALLKREVAGAKEHDIGRPICLSR
jgi:hypothetical protein